jgi:hypothetical protein
MQLYIFKSETRKGLHAFAGDLMGSKLPQNHGPWTVTGVVGPDMSPPHNFARDAIEEAIDVEGFQLWRLSKTGGSLDS